MSGSNCLLAGQYHRNVALQLGLLPATGPVLTTNTTATAIPVTPETMNYASVVFAGFSVIAAVWYVVNARKHYTGPQVTLVRRQSIASNAPHH